MLDVLKKEITPYNHQVSACNFALRRFGAGEGGDATSPLVHRGCALLMEM